MNARARYTEAGEGAVACGCLGSAIFTFSDRCGSQKKRKIAYDFYLRATEVREVRKIAGVALSLKSGLRLPGPIFFGKFSGPRWVGCAGVAGKQSKAKGKPEP